MSDDTPRLLIVEDDESMQDFLTAFLESEGYQVRGAPHGGVAKEMLDREPFHVVLADILMPEVDGVEVLDYVRERHPDTAVIIMTGRSSIRQAVDLIRRGADDYFKKPFDLEEMLHVIRRCLEHRSARRPGPCPAPGEGSPPPDRPGAACPHIIGRSAAMAPVFEMIAKVADTHSTVLIQGESGTGKELVAFAIHENSSRSSRPFLPVHCGAIPETLLESELFGHEKGSFTGAVARKDGVFALADGGTLFLDEVSEMSMPLQVKLLRVLETGAFRRVGGVEDLRVDVRVVAATNRILRELVDKGRFRDDLFYRLNVFPITVPPLRDRAGDIPLLVDHLVGKLRRAGHEFQGLSEDTLALLRAYHWPGNVRELENVLERAAILCNGGPIRPEHLPAELRQACPEGPDPQAARTFREAKSAFIKHYLQECLADHEGCVTAAAEAAHLSRAHFYELIKKHDIPLPSESKNDSPDAEAPAAEGEGETDEAAHPASCRD